MAVSLVTPPVSGAFTVLPGGEIAVYCVPRVPNSYKAELVGILLGSSLSPDGQCIRLDCQGAIAAANSRKLPVRQSYWVQKVRVSIIERKQRLDWVEKHVGHDFNEISDRYAKLGTALPLPSPQTRATRWDIIRSGEQVLPPDKTWTQDLVPTHTHDHFHLISWRPLRHKRLAWHKWLFGLQSRPSYHHYATFWRDEVPSMRAPIVTAAKISVSMVPFLTVHSPTPLSMLGCMPGRTCHSCCSGAALPNVGIGVSLRASHCPSPSTACSVPTREAFALRAGRLDRTRTQSLTL